MLVPGLVREGEEPDSNQNKIKTQTGREQEPDEETQFKIYPRFLNLKN